MFRMDKICVPKRKFLVEIKCGFRNIDKSFIPMTTNRLEAFSDGVLAIIITIMVLQVNIPEGSSFESLRPLLPKFLSYIFSFIYVGIYWNNHHHLFQVTSKVNGKVLWGNLNLLFWLSLLPVATNWIGETVFASNPVAVYGFILMMCAIAYHFLESAVIHAEGRDSKLAQAVKSRWKEKISTVLYLLGIVVSFFYPYVSVGIYYVVAIMWLVPDLRIEKELKEN